MSITRAAVRARLQELLGDMNPDARVVGQFRYNEVISRNMNMLASRSIRPRETELTVAVVAGTYDYTLDVTKTIATVSSVYDYTNWWELEFLEFEAFNRAFRENTVNPPISGRLSHYTLWETAGQLGTLRVGPMPNAATSLRVHYGILPAALASESTAIPFTLELQRALESFSAAELISTLGDERLQKLGLSRSVVGLWQAQGQQALRDHNKRQGSMGRVNRGVLRVEA